MPPPARPTASELPYGAMPFAEVHSASTHDYMAHRVCSHETVVVCGVAARPAMA